MRTPLSDVQSSSVGYAVVFDLHLVPVSLERLADAKGEVGIVFNEENACHQPRERRAANYLQQQ